MLITNKFNLPEPIYQAILWLEQSHKSNADISCTMLVDSPLRAWLGHKYYDQLEEDASERIWALQGSIVHAILERFGKTSGLHVEKQVIVKDILGWSVSAILDCVIKDGALMDYKYTSVFALKGGMKSEWVAQLNIGAWLAKHCSDETMVKALSSVSSLKSYTIYRDWRLGEAAKEGSKYPRPSEWHDVPVWSEEQTEKYIKTRVALHQEARNNPGVPPICIDSERWMTDFAVCIQGKPKAEKAKFKSHEEAREWLDRCIGENPKAYVRDAVPKRCSMYCIYSKCNVCPWYDLESKTTRTEPLIADVVKGVAADPDHARKDASNA